MPPKCEDGDCCLPTSFTYNFKCGICCSVFHTREEKTRHNLLHFIPCTMCRETLRSRDHLFHHLKTMHEQKDLTHVKRHANNCKTYNLPVIPRPNRSPATKVEMVKKVDEVKEGIKVKKEEGMVVNSGLPIFHRYFNALDPLCLLKFFICNFRKLARVLYTRARPLLAKMPPGQPRHLVTDRSMLRDLYAGTSCKGLRRQSQR